MNAEIEQTYHLIGERLALMAEGPFSAVWVRVEIADDFGSVGVFLDRGKGSIDYLTDSEGHLYRLFSELRRRFSDGGFGTWTQATFALQDKGTFKVEFGFDDVSDLGQSAVRREAWIRRMLGSHTQINWPRK